MKNKTNKNQFRAKAASAIATACLWALFAASAQGAVFMSISPASIPAVAGSTGNVFDVLLTNTG